MIYPDSDDDDSDDDYGRPPFRALAGAGTIIEGENDAQIPELVKTILNTMKEDLLNPIGLGITIKLDKNIEDAIYATFFDQRDPPRGEPFIMKILGGIAQRGEGENRRAHKYITAEFITISYLVNLLEPARLREGYQARSVHEHVAVYLQDEGTNSKMHDVVIFLKTIWLELHKNNTRLAYYNGIRDDDDPLGVLVGHANTDQIVLEETLPWNLNTGPLQGRRRIQ